MGKSWQEGFDFYMAQNEPPVMVLLDMEAVPHVPLASHPVRFDVLIPMRQPRPDGLRSREESEALFALEDALVDALAPLDVLYLGRSVAQGETELMLYAPGALELAAVERAVEAARGEYAVRVKRTDDPGWLGYRERLYPGPLQRQLMLNRALMDQLQRNGDRHEVPRNLDHLAYFESEADASRAAARLAELGFAVKQPELKSGARAQWGLPFTRTDALAEGRVDEVTAEIFEVVDACGGHYDGWGCVVQQEKPGLLARLFGGR